MKKLTKLGIGGLGLLMGAMVLTGCTASFCSTNDKAHMMYMFDYGVSEYHNDAGTPDEPNSPVRGFDNLYVSVNRPTVTQSGIGATDNNKNGADYIKPTDEFLVELDTVVLQHAVVAYYNKTNETSLKEFTEVPASYISDVVSKPTEGDLDNSKHYVQDILDEFGYLKFADTNSEKGNILFYNYDIYLNETKALVTEGILTRDDFPSDEYVKLYKTQMKNLIASYRSCIAITTDKYGYYGYGSTRDKTVIEKKDWGYAWKKGFFEGLLVYPIAWCVDSLTNAFSGIKVSGFPQLLAILIVTIVLRLIILFSTGLKQSQNTAKMTMLQPEIQKIQAKYPNANSNQYEKQRMAEEMSRLYKKNKINPLTTFLGMFIQFPIFICVWGGLQGAAVLSSDAFLGLYLSMSVRDALFNGAMWKSGGAVTALILFILLIVVQFISMMLPMYFQKKAAKKAAKLGKNPAQKSSDNKQKYFLIIMFVMIIFISFSTASALGFYWLVGAVVTIIQTIISTKLAEKRKQQQKR